MRDGRSGRGTYGSSKLKQHRDRLSVRRTAQSASAETLQICPDSKIGIPRRLFQTTGSPSSRNPIRTSTWKVGSPALFTEPRILLTSNQSIFRIVWRALIIALRTCGCAKLHLV